MNSLETTAEFMRAAGQTIPEQPTLPETALAFFRAALIEEELGELRQALFDGNMVEILDALADLQVVLSGAVLAFGLGEVFPAALAEVHRSNMSKFCTTEEEAFDTIDHYAKQGVSCQGWPTDGLFVMKRSCDHKVLKSVNYSPANLAPLLP